MRKIFTTVQRTACLALLCVCGIALVSCKGNQQEPKGGSTNGGETPVNTENFVFLQSTPRKIVSAQQDKRFQPINEWRIRINLNAEETEFLYIFVGGKKITEGSYDLTTDTFGEDAYWTISYVKDGQLLANGQREELQTLPFASGTLTVRKVDDKGNICVTISKGILLGDEAEEEYPIECSINTSTLPRAAQPVSSPLPQTNAIVINGKSYPIERSEEHLMQGQYVTKELYFNRDPETGNESYIMIAFVNPVPQETTIDLSAFNFKKESYQIVLAHDGNILSFSDHQMKKFSQFVEGTLSFQQKDKKHFSVRIENGCYRNTSRGFYTWSKVGECSLSLNYSTPQE